MKELIKLPRLEKKKLKKELWLYPADKNGNSLMAQPEKYKEDYEAMKAGIAQNIKNRNIEKDPELTEALKNIDNEIYVSNEELRQFVNKIFAKDYRASSYQILLDAKKNKKAKVAYFNFINTYYIDKNFGNYSNACCFSVDFAQMILKEVRRKQNKKRKRHNS